MEDASLDDFFAKKDKSKKKSKSSKSTPGDILSKTDEPAKKEKKTKKDKDKSHGSSNTTDDNRTTGAIEEEWKEQEEEKEKDYTGLRIANLQTSEEGNEEEEQQEEKEEEEDENGEIKEKKDTGQQGPWKGSGAAPVVVKPKPVPVPQPVEESPAAEKPVAEAPKPTKYIPPGQRAGAAGASSTGPTLPSHLKKKKNAPNLRSEEDFPTLGGGPMPVQADGDSRVFERVQYGGRQTDEVTKGSQQLSLGNKFSALQD